MLISRLIAENLDTTPRMTHHAALVALGADEADLAERLERGEFARITSALDPVCRDASVLLLVGSEAGGPSGAETLAVLFSAVTELLRGCASRPRIVVQGGIATPEAAAAYLLTGADGVLLESVHWLTSGVPGSETSKNRIAGLRPDHFRIIGQRLGAPCRFFDKGNSRAVREMEALADALCLSGADETARQTFLDEAARLQVPALAAAFNADELISLGPEAAFARAFVDRFGTDTGAALDGFARAVEAVMARGPQLLGMFADAPAARSLGTRYPFLQGGMTWITDKPLFARAVAEAGALPTLALGSRDRARLEEDFADLRATMAGLPYAMNVLVLEENRFRDEQLAWLEEHKPPFVAIAAGDPSFAVRLKKKGMRAIYLCPDEGLLRLALEAGVDFVVLEGTEAGGHVGSHSTQMLAQMALELRRREPRLFEDSHVVLAGGVYDRASALRALVLGAEAVQLGTAYLATEEIVATGALPALYQRLILEARPCCTAVSGETVGLRVRSLLTPRMEAILELERDFAAGNEDEKSFRKRLETLSVGTLLIATRQMRRPGADLLDEETCRLEGQYMSGAVAGCIGHATRLDDLHRELASAELVLPVMSASRVDMVRPAFSPPARRGGGRPERIAITGLSLANSLGNDEEDFWQSCLAMKSGVTEVPPARWNHALHFHPDPRVANKTYSPVGAFASLNIERKDLWVTPQDFRTMSVSMRSSLLLAKRAIRQAGLDAAGLPPERVSVIVSQNSGEAAGPLADQVIFVYAEEAAELARTVLGVSPAQARKLVEAIRAGRLGVDDTTLIGRLNCTAAGHISNRFGFMGPSYSVGAACATSLVALHAAVMLMRQGLIDAAVVGGGEEPLSPAHFMEFSALGALAGLTGQRTSPAAYSRPFDQGRDGFVMGEGGAMLVIERESVARARGARPLAYITGVGAANNDKGIVESVAESQMVALRLSFEDAGYGPDEVDLVECHATSTMQGDREEVSALRGTFPSGSGTVLAGLKSQIGHTLGASGATAIGRAVLAMRDGVLPATLNLDHPDPALGIAEHGFRVLGTPEGWPDKGRPRRAQVNAFGFGGASFVIHLEGAEENAGRVVLPMPQAAPAEAETRLGVRAFCAAKDGAAWRVAAVANTAIEARSVLLAATPFPSGDDRRALAALARAGVFAAPATASLPAALVLSGQGGFYPGMGRALYETFSGIRLTMDRLAAVADFDLLAVLFEADEQTLRHTRWQQPALFTLEYAIARQLMDLGFAPAAMAGHSLGELTALTLAGVMTPEDGLRVVSQRGLCMELAAEQSADPGTMVATDAPAEIVDRMLAKREAVVVTNYNSPRQTVFGGFTEATLLLAEELRSQGFRCTQLAVSLAFHSPIMQAAETCFAEFLAGIELQAPRIPVISNVTREPFPDDPGSIREIMVRHLETAVAWTSNVQTLWLDFGVRVFVEAGPGHVLCNLIGDIFEQARCVHTCTKGEEPLSLRKALAGLHAWGLLALPLEDGLLELGGPDSAAASAPAASATTASAPVGAAQNTGVSVETSSVQAPPRAGVLEDVIAIIMEATGYERSEIEPDMDIRQDLAIRSSRLPVIMDQAEKQFDIVIRIEDFIGVNTVRDMAVRIAELSGRTLEEDAPTASGVGQTLEQVIAIIMEATGYERSEIEPDMDIRQDLAIRSSRLPVIMDQAEKQFDIVIRIEDFIGVNTVRDMATRIDALRVPSQAPRPAMQARPAPGPRPLDVPLAPEPVAGGGPRGPVSRLGFQTEPLEEGSGTLLSLDVGACVAVITLGQGTGLEEEVAAFVSEALGAAVLPLQAQAADPDAVALLATRDNLAGVIFVVGTVRDCDTAMGLLTSAFACFQHLVGRRSRRLGLVVYRREAGGEADLLAEGILGMFLAGRLEYASMHLRLLGLDTATSPAQALRRAFDTVSGPVQMLCAQGNFASVRAVSRPVRPLDRPQIEVDPGSVIVLSGGAKGVTKRVALALAVHRPHLVLLGRSRPDAQTDGLVAQLRGLGAGAEYIACDVTDGQAVQAVMADVAARLGGIHGIVHGAGLLRDGLIVNTSLRDFALVATVKVQGLRNLLSACRDKGLRFALGFSSVAAWQGNVGQSSYCAANRAMAALLNEAAQSGILARAVWLPPIEGAGGMADDPETRELMRLKGLEQAFVHVDEFRELLLREMACGPTNETGVMFSRPLPDTDTILAPRYEAPDDAGRAAWGLDFPAQLLPMVDGIEGVDLAAGGLTALRTFSHAVDLWLPEHRPYPEMRHPLVSAVMAVETLLEGARLAAPYLTPIGLHDVRFMDMIPVPRDVSRQTRTRFVREGSKLAATLEAREISPSGRPLDRWTVCYAGRIELGRNGQLASIKHLDIDGDGRDTHELSRSQLEKLYAENTGQSGRYRIIDLIHKTGPGWISGRVVYPEVADFAGQAPVGTCYPLYLLEAMMQLAVFHDLVRQGGNPHAPLPVRIQEIRLGLGCAPGQVAFVRAVQSHVDDKGVTWDAQAVDEQGEVLLQALGITLGWTR
jgi:acyl transferase domain-containing protein/NAD(P)H-dependent flavin oxidoreductase YrpB (nitropropane dioxygenase family)/acyl carrier protein/NADP-dependent 3-hydroxy acid dehydrogenase YdfG